MDTCYFALLAFVKLVIALWAFCIYLWAIGEYSDMYEHAM